MDETELKTLGSMGLDKSDIEKENKVFSVLQGALQSELSAIKEYQGYIDTINQELRDNVPGINKEKLALCAETLKSVIVEEYKHVGEFQSLIKLVDPNAKGIDEGAKEPFLGK